MPCLRAPSLARLMLSLWSNPQHNEKNNHYLPGCFLHCIDRHFLCRPGLQSETHITRQPTTRRRQRRDSSRLRFQWRCVELAAKRNSAHPGLIRAGRAARAFACPGAGSLAGFRHHHRCSRCCTKQKPHSPAGPCFFKRSRRRSGRASEPDCATPAVG
jgi:hypothetical protein